MCPDDQTLECLMKQDHERLNKKCRQAVFADEKEEVMHNSADAILAKYCANEISRHCEKATGANAILTCLKENKDDNDFDPKCRKIVVRRIVQQMTDYRLNPKLQRACALDLPKFCNNVIEEQSDSDRDFLEGKVIQCLKDQLIKNGKMLTKTCRRQVNNLMAEAAVDIRANPQLAKECPNSISACRTSLKIRPEDEDGGQIEECLKDKFRRKRLNEDPPSCLTEVAKLIGAESMDIEIDHVLREACQVDLAKFCHGVSPGSGRQITCLRNVRDDKNMQLESKCEALLSQRLEMYRQAMVAVPMASVKDLYEQIYASPHRNYFLIVILTLVGVIFVGGLMCGRVTKRVRRELKNR